jgi:hypothetical protein
VSALRPLLLVLLVLAAPLAGADDDEVERLRAENARLKAQIEAMQHAQGAAPAAAAPAAVPAPVKPAAPAAAVAAPAPAPVVAAPAPAASAPAAPVAASAPPPGYTPPPGYKLVPAIDADHSDFSAPPYDKTGCSLGLISRPKPAKWTNLTNWSLLYKHMSMTEVEDLIGKEHFDVKSGANVEWQYGNCGGKVSGFVLFTDSKVSAWQVPSL